MIYSQLVSAALAMPPALGAHYDFISKLWLYDLSSYRIKLKRLHQFKKKPSKTKSPVKNKKLPINPPAIVRKITNFFTVIIHLRVELKN